MELFEGERLEYLIIIRDWADNTNFLGLSAFFVRHNFASGFIEVPGATGINDKANGEQIYFRGSSHDDGKSCCQCSE